MKFCELKSWHFAALILLVSSHKLTLLNKHPTDQASH